MRDDLGPISVSAPSTSLTTAQGQNLTFNTKYPFAKLDSTNKNSFQVITVFFNTEPPNPTGGPGTTTTKKSLIYQYSHGYTYKPSTWFLISTDNFATVLGSEGAWLIGNASGASPKVAKFEIEVDGTYVNFYIDKQWTNTGVNSPPNVIGFTVNVRAYVFTEGLDGTSVPSHV